MQVGDTVSLVCNRSNSSGFVALADNERVFIPFASFPRLNESGKCKSAKVISTGIFDFQLTTPCTVGCKGCASSSALQQTKREIQENTAPDRSRMIRYGNFTTFLQCPAVSRAMFRTL